MKTVISCKINNLIRNYCNNFLSYLYKQNGWNRTAFETCKEKFIPSNIPGEEIRILISNTGTISLTCYCLFDVLKALEYINEQFEYGRMGYYLVMDENTEIKTSYTTTIDMKEYDFDEKESLTTKYGKVEMYGQIATLTYDKWENGKELIELINMALEEKEDEMLDDVKENEMVDDVKDDEKENDVLEGYEKKEDNMQNEKIMLSLLFIYTVVRLAQIL